MSPSYLNKHNPPVRLVMYVWILANDATVKYLTGPRWLLWAYWERLNISHVD